MDGPLSLQAPPQAERALGISREPALCLHGRSPCGHAGYSCQSSSCALGPSVLWASWPRQGGPRGHSSHWRLPCAPPAWAAPPLSCHRLTLWPLPWRKPLPPCGRPRPFPWSPPASVWGLAWPVLRPREQVSGLDELVPALGARYSARADGRSWQSLWPAGRSGPAGSPICCSPQRERNGAASRRGSG